LGHVGVVLEAEVLESLDEREAGVEQPAAFATLRALGDLGVEQRGEVGDRGLLLAHRIGGELAEAAADGGELELDGVRFDERLDRGRLRVAGRAHRPAPRWSRSRS
jgi:hypothetical protein